MKKIDENYFIKDKNDNKENKNIEDIVDSDEKILWEAKPKKQCFIANIVLKPLLFIIIWLIFDVALITILFLNMENIPWFVYLLISIFFLFHLFPVWKYIVDLASAKKRHEKEEYAFTDTRILVKKGLIAQNIISIHYDSLTSVNLRVGVVEKLFKVGDIYIVSNNESVVLEDIEDPYFVCNKLQQIALEHKKDIYFPSEIKDKLLNK